MIRKPSVAGQFYPGSSLMLKKELAFLINKKEHKLDCIGAVSPHAGYIYSGPVAGKVFSRIKLKNCFIIMGPNHTGRGKQFSIMAKGTYEMPQGNVGIDEKLAKALLQNSKHLEIDEAAHAAEHSIEVQLPFIQYLKKDFKFVPIVISHSSPNAYKELGKEMAAVIKKYKKEVVMIASSDMTHYEKHESAKTKDKYAIDAILDLDTEALMNAIMKYDISMCGYAPTIVMLEAAKELGAKKAELVDYKTSGDTSGDYSSVVGYAGIIVAK